MKEGPDIARIAALIGDPARANMLTALMSGKALTASELSAEAGVTLQTASSHLSKLSEGGLVRMRKQGRHKYFTLTDPDVARVLEGLMGLAAGAGHLRNRTGPRDAELRRARVCYNHLAGDLGTQMFDRMVELGYLAPAEDALDLTPAGRDFSAAFLSEIETLEQARAPLCRECLDWSERRSHLAGSLGRAFLGRFEALGWAHRVEGTRIVRFSPRGLSEFHVLFGLSRAGDHPRNAADF